MFYFRGNKQCGYFLSFSGISADKLDGWVIVCESFLTSLIFSLTVLITVDATSLDKSSTLKNDESGKTIDILNEDPIKLQEYAYEMLVYSI